MLSEKLGEADGPGGRRERVVLDLVGLDFRLRLADLLADIGDLAPYVACMGSMLLPNVE